MTMGLKIGDIVKGQRYRVTVTGVAADIDHDDDTFLLGDIPGAGPSAWIDPGTAVVEQIADPLPDVVGAMIVATVTRTEEGPGSVSARVVLVKDENGAWRSLTPVRGFYVHAPEEIGEWVRFNPAVYRGGS